METKKSNQTSTLDDAIEIVEIGIRLGEELGEILRFPVNHAKLDGLFEDMKNSKYKTAFEKVLQRIYQTPRSSPNWETRKDVLESYMGQYRFEIPK